MEQNVCTKQLTTTTSRLKPFIHCTVMLLFILLARFVPPMGGLTSLGVQTLGIFVAIVYGWSTLGFIMPSMIGILAFGFLGENDMVTTLSTAFGDKVTVIVLMFFLIAALAEQSGLCDYIARWCTTRKFVIGKPWGIAIMFCVAGALISSLVNTFAAMFLMWGIFVSYCDETGFKHGDKYPMLVLMGLLYCCSISAGILPYMGMGILVISQLQSFAGMSINYFQFTVVQLILVVFSLSVYFLVCKYIFRPDVSLITNKKEGGIDNISVPTLTKQQKLVCGLILSLILMLFLPELLPDSIWLIGLFDHLDVAGVAIMALIIYYVVNLGTDEVIPLTKLAQGLSWDMIFMFATIAVLSKAIVNEDAGIITFIHQNLSSFLTGMSPILFIVMLFVISSLITQIANNAVVISVIGPIMFTLGDMVNVNPHLLTVIAVPFLSVAFMTPAASVPAAMAFSDKNWIGTKNAYMIGAMIFVINIIMMLVAIPLAGVFF